MKTPEEIAILPKSERAYYHILNDLQAELKDLEDLMEMDEPWSEGDMENFKGKKEGIELAINLITRAIDDFESRSSK